MSRAMNILKKYSLALVSAIALFVAAYSSSACFVWLVHQRKCPKSLIKAD